MRTDSPRFVFIVGGVLSGLGKGVVTASLARLVQDSGYRVTVIKIDPYVNVDAGTMRPTEHGEIFVTEDGGEIDQDFGTYERFLGINLSKDNNITTGKVFLRVIQKERSLEYGGRDVKLIPDVTNEIKQMILEASQDVDVSFVEVGGTTGDIENLIFLYALRDLMREYRATTVMVSYVPFLRNVGELKTKPTQHAVARLREAGLFPDFLVARSERGLDAPRIEKIASTCFIPRENIIDDPDIECVYEVPLIFERQGFAKKVLEKLGLKFKHGLSEEWKRFVEEIKSLDEKVRIALIGKYVTHGSSEHRDVYISVVEAIRHACYHLRLKPEIKQIFSRELEGRNDVASLEEFDGIVVPGGFGEKGVEGKIFSIKYCRENNVPFLGLCFGMQLAVVEYARNVCGLEGANSTEIDPNTPHPVVDILPEQKKLLKKKKYGATMRLGAYPAVLKKGSLVYELYGRKEVVYERHRHRYEVNPKYVEVLESDGLVFSGKSPDGKLMEFLEIPSHTFFLATQAHPEFKSRVLKPHPVFSGFVESCK